MSVPARKRGLLESAESRMRLAIALSQCRLGERRLLALLFVEGLGAREVAKVLGLSLPEVRRRRAELLARLRRMVRGLAGPSALRRAPSPDALRSAA